MHSLWTLFRTNVQNFITHLGHHVRFGPTKWEKPEGYLVPQTLEVTGVCQKNPEEQDEEKWVWGACDQDIPFDDLWFASK